MVVQVGLDGAERLNGDVIDILPQLIDIMPLLLERLEDSLDTSFMAHIHLLLITIEHKIWAVLIDRVIRQVHAHIIEVGIGWCHVGLSGQPHQSVPIGVDPHGVGAGQKHINPKVELQTIDEEGFMHVALRNIMISWVDAVDGTGEEDPLTLAASLRFDDECPRFTLLVAGIYVYLLKL